VSTTQGNLRQNLPPVLLIPVANLLPVSLIPGAILPTVSLTPVANVPPGSLIPVLHLDLSSRIYKKIQNGPKEILWAGGKLIHEKTRSKNSRDTVPLNVKILCQFQLYFFYRS
jgi:hypothetical protein